MSDLPLNRLPLSSLAENVAISGDLVRETTVLAGGATYTSRWIDVSAFANIRLRSIADQASALLGVALQWSYDGVNPIAPLAFNGSALLGVLLDSGLIVRDYNYARAIYLNGAAAQTAFRLTLEGYQGGGGGGGGPVVVNLEADLQTMPVPDPSSIYAGALAHLRIDPDHSLRTRSRVLTDEGMFADDFGSTVYPAATIFRPGVGNLTLTLNSLAWSRVAATTPLREGDYIEITALHSDAAPVMRQIDTIAAGGLSGTLVTPWTAATTTGAWQVSNYWLQIPVAGTAAVANSTLTLSAGGGAGDVAQILRNLNYGGRKGTTPLYCSVSLCNVQARSVDNYVMVGLVNPLGPTTPPYAVFEFNGSTVEVFNLSGRSEGGASDLQTIQYALPAGITSSSPMLLEIWQRGHRVSWAVNGQSYPDFTLHFPYPYQSMALGIISTNIGGSEGAVTIVIDEVIVRNLDEIDALTSQPDENKLRASVKDITIFATGVPRAPTVIDDDLVHELTDAAGSGMDAEKDYSVQQIGGADICVYVAAAAPAVATCRYGDHLFNGIPWLYTPPTSGLRLWAVKAVDGTADANVTTKACNGGGGA